jgi:DNA-binding transcriptional MerR regulator
MIEKYKNFKGSRKDLMEVISNLEKHNPKKFMMYSKKYKEYLPVNIRRIQQFSDKGLLPTNEVNNKNYVYNFDHLLMYASIMKLKNDGYTLLQIAKIIKGYDTQKLTELVENKVKSDKEIIDHKNINEKNILSEKLVKLGREEGRVLRSQWIKFAVTRWCNIEIRKNKLDQITDDDLNIILAAFEDSIKDTIDSVRQDKLEQKIS